MKHGRLAPVAIMRGFALALTLFLCGCTTLHQTPAGEETPPAILPTDADAEYTLACPDTVEVRFDDWPEMNRTATIGPDGCIEVGELGRIEIEGDTTIEAAQGIAARARLPLSKVRVQIAEYKSRHVYLFGQVRDNARAVSYQGPERVLDLLRRARALADDAEPSEVYLVRPQLAEARRAVVLTVDLQAIREHGDQRTNYRVQPLDEIYVGAKPGSKLADAVPPVLKPAYSMVRALVRGG